MKVAFTELPFPSVTVTSFTDSDGKPSSSVIVPIPCGSGVVALSAPERLSAKVSLTSSRRSPFTATVTVLVVSPAAKLSVPLLAA